MTNLSHVANGDILFNGRLSLEVIGRHGEWVWVIPTREERRLDGPLTFRLSDLSRSPAKERA